MAIYKNNAYITVSGALKWPQKIATIMDDGKDQITYGELDTRSNQVAHALKGLGLNRGDKVATLMYNSIPLVESYYGIQKAGAVVVALNYRLGPNELAKMINESEATILIFGQEFAEKAEIIRQKLPQLKHLMCVGKETLAWAEDYYKWVSHAPSGEIDAEIEDDDPCMYVFTSGSTSEPKSAVKTHRNCLYHAMNAALCWQHSPKDIHLHTGYPLASVGFVNLFGANLVAGATVVVMKSFEPDRVLENVQRWKITTLYLVPTMWNLIFQLPNLDAYDFSSVRLVSWGGEPMSPALEQKIQKRFPGVLQAAYGSTETGLMMADASTTARKSNCVGKIEGLGEYCVVDEQGKFLPNGEVGELVYRGPCMMLGYNKRPEVNKKVIKNGWVYTGDMALIDEDNDFQIVGRKDFQINSGGYKIYPDEVEAVLYKHPAIVESAVAGVPDPIFGQAIAAFVVLKPGQKITEEEIINFCKENIASYKKPKYIRFVDALPKNPAGKIMRGEILPRFWRGQ